MVQGTRLRPKKVMASTYKGDLNTSPYKPDSAMDGKEDTYWSSSDRYKFEWIGVKFDKPMNVGSIKMKIRKDTEGPAMVIVEKSMDGEWWSRSTEIPKMEEWSKGDGRVYPLIQMNSLPSSVFAFRSQKNPHFCVGVRPTPHPTDEKAEPYALFEDAKLEIQICDDDTNTQYWVLSDDEPDRPMLKNAADQSFIAHVEGTDLTVRQCKDGCSEYTEDGFGFSEGEEGGMAYNFNKKNFIFYPKGGNDLAAGTEVVLETCGDDVTEPAKIEACADKELGQWELLPMFILEPGKETEGCAPYSHDNVEPETVNSRQAAQELCAKDKACVAYNYADDTAEPYNNKNKVWACTAMHIVYSGVPGFELGIRAGKLEPFVEEEAREAKATRKWTMYADL